MRQDANLVGTTLIYWGVGRGTGLFASIDDMKEEEGKTEDSALPKSGAGVWAATDNLTIGLSNAALTYGTLRNCADVDPASIVLFCLYRRRLAENESGDQQGKGRGSMRPDTTTITN
ncbi:hypothetical protein T069G_09396 [Trichoderma breve]|uniref:Uncharacterized protein n=1 Tax=Trichoderma breve TaxID=2034170 RepID=A0A9W9B4F7_9HYPO|nr:hypothetical protein T069G_09396 [Trichoderma breve]KAJ4856028.1 hypothetical protein T069G_09396 [Trichoderma breve]